MDAFATEVLPFGRLLRSIVVSVLAAAAIAVFTPAGARADYSVTECAPSQWWAPDVGWIGYGSYSVYGSAECPGWGLKLWGGPGYSAQGSYLAWQVNAPGGTKFRSASALVHYGWANGFGSFTNGNGVPGYAALGYGQNLWVRTSQTNTDYFGIVETCVASQCSPGAQAYAYSTEFSATVQDFYPPGVSASGDLLDGGVIQGVHTLQTTATDYGGGARSISVHVNGLYSKGVDFCPPDGPGGSYRQVKPCPSDSGAKVMQIDTEHDPGWVDGSNEVVICSTDAAGNGSSPCLKRTVQVDNSCPGSGGQQASQLVAGADVGGRLRSEARVRSTDSPVIRGGLTTPQGNPVSGATVCAYETIDLADSSRQLVAKATTQPNGRFAVKLDPGASRRLNLVYRYNARMLEGAVNLDSTVVPTLAVGKRHVQNGQRTSFRGSLPGPNAAGRAVTLQARAGRKWRTFKQLKTDESGAFKGLYRFTQTHGRARYTFRALVKRQGGYPYEPGSSKKRRVVVTG
ncbi:MAG: hypothetical protein ACRDK5_02730 [Solirubrobacterales bacterium]